MDFDLHSIVVLLQSGSWRLGVAAGIMLLVWLVRLIPWVRDRVLTTPWRKRAAVAVLSLAPVLVMVAGKAPMGEIVVTALTVWTSAMGWREATPKRTNGGTT